MFNNNESQNKIPKTIYDHEYEISVRCKAIKNTGLITNYFINIEGCKGGITVLLDKNGNSMLSQIKL
ncbi:DUF6440 family protein [Clostridium estertheticum]|uniref:DUF6440 domain-containing protein n=1 Tax=Clostridium estertheticum subsp. estertheticum TaxID=1552 RepID=A0A1J0GDJ9_9CLOT|nr:DUF6440 family protein [Clostridium estertheticum]APC39434.1 hypothetical protein A7L45_04835 [Clostridium estertheticum subsp. estertheticum]MBU3072111.1 hypothetical protein [Clostridium estertheticum]MBU3162203.1 hypothetical protein [Clostridium estertheticum]MBU3170634.1 hypothetical protein [Clostridium estertheticum]MBU3184736.1 hypothetical protein [Clostridium estertheticum]